MSAIFRKITALAVAVLTVFSSVAFIIPTEMQATAAETVTDIGDEEALRSALEGSGGSYSLSNDISLTVTEYEEYRYTVTAKVSLDLNGHSITVKNTANLNGDTNDSTLIKIENGGDLTVSDSSPNEIGKLSYVGGVHLYLESDDYADYTVVTGRHLFYLCEGAVLTVNSGSYVAGNTEKEWLHRAAGVIDKKFEYYTGFSENTVCGTVITVASNASLTVNGGNFEANGRKRQNILPNLKGWNEERPASVCIRAEAKAKVVVNDGSFVGAHGADVFYLDTTSKSSIKAGKFETTPSVNERLVDYMDFATLNVSTYYGKLNLPTVFIPGNSRAALYQNGASLEKTADAVDGSPVYLTPNTADFATISSYFSSGIYTPGSKGTLSSGYTPYFTDGSTLVYSWYAISANGMVTPIANSNTTQIDLSKLASNGITLSLGSKYSFACVITETFKNYTLTTVSRTINLSTTNKNILAAVSLTPSRINNNNHYYSGIAPSFTVPSSANYQISSVKWYERNSLTDMGADPVFKENSAYFTVITLSAKGNYLFTADTKISYLPGGSSAVLAPSADGKTATVSAWIYTACSHSVIEYVINPYTHEKICAVCGLIMASEKHTYSGWTEEGISSDTIPMVRECTICSHKENSALFAPVEGEKTPIYEIKTDIGVPSEGSAPAAPALSSTPDASRVVIDSYTWLTDSGAAFTKFESGKNYTLTVVYKLADAENNVFSESTLVSSVHPSTVSLSLNEDKTELTAVFSVTTNAVGGREIYIPTIKIGQKVSDANIDIWGTATLYWYKDGKKIGYTEITDNSDTQVDYDFDPDDDIDFLTHTFVDGSVYALRINWHITPGNRIVDSDIRLTNAVPMDSSILGGEFGFVTAYFIPRSAEKYIRTVKVSGITEPSASASAKTSGASVDSTCTVKSISFTSGGSKVTKFECSKQYTVSVTVAPKDGYEFALESATINGHGVTVTESGSNIILTYTFDTLEHDIDNRNATVTSPTCDSDGSIVGKCKSCSATSNITIPKLGHAIEEVIGVASTCEKDGVSTHFRCIYCQKLYNDDKALTEITTDSTVIAKDSSKHVGSTVTAHDGNNHFTVCLGCAATLDSEVAHEYGDAAIDSDGNEYYSCQCGHSVPASGPKQPEFLIGGVEEEVTQPQNGWGLDFGSFSIETIKTILIVMVVFAVLLIGSIITISVILIVTRDRSGKQLLPDEENTKEKTTTVSKE